MASLDFTDIADADAAEAVRLPGVEWPTPLSCVPCSTSRFTKSTLPVGMTSSACSRVAVDQNTAGAWSGEPGQKPRRVQNGKPAMKRYVCDGVPIGLLGYSSGEPVAWCSIAPRQPTVTLAVQPTSANVPKTYGRWPAFHSPRVARQRPDKNGPSWLRCGLTLPPVVRQTNFGSVIPSLSDDVCEPSEVCDASNSADEQERGGA